jgi:alpha-D-xyloside xylohydrolase
MARFKPGTWLLALLSGLSMTGVSAFEKTDDGILLRFDGAAAGSTRLLRVTVCSDSIIRVTATPDRFFSLRQSLAVQNTGLAAASWSVKEEGPIITLSTSSLRVRVDTATAAVSFFDKAGRPVLAERPEGRTFTAAEALGEPVWKVRQIFDSPEGEALYGLGQHQNGVMNWKDKDADLWQYNIVAAVPFLVSNRSYGLLWDNNSHTKFGDPREYGPLSSLVLYGNDGTRGGLTTEYFANPDFTSPVLKRSEPVIDHKYLDAYGDWPESVTPGRGSIRWSGFVESGEAGSHKFRLYASTYFKLWLDGTLVADGWRQNWLPWTRFATLNMEAGRRYAVKFEWIPDGGFAGLEVLGPEPAEMKNAVSLQSDVGDQTDYYFIFGKPDEAVKGYRALTGKAPMMPRWSMGLWQCRERYRSADELTGTVKEFRDRRIPLDAIVQDWFYWREDDWGSHAFDASRFPDPEAMVRRLHDELKAHVMISVWPKFYTSTEHYREFEDNGWLYRRNVEAGQKDWVGPGYVSTFFDPYSKGARDLYWKQIDEHLFRKGFDAWWLDATEPDVCSNLSPKERLLRMHPTALGSAARYENTFSLQETRAVYEGQRKSDPDKRVFILTRSAFTGQQRYAASLWSGDVAARWIDLKNQIPAGLNLCLSGIPFWTTDIGGFAVEPRFERAKGEDLEEFRELTTRWFQFGAFCPLFRVHGQFPYREMYNVAPPDHPAYRSMLAYDELRYRLMPYIYSLNGRVYFEDYTVMRALVMDFGNDRAVLNIADQFMFGPSLLVNPVTERGAKKRTVVLPAGSGWYDMETGAWHRGGQTVEADAPYEKMPVFVREGAIVPTGPALQYTDEKPADPVRLHVFDGKDGRFTLYEDNGSDYGYERGECATIELSYKTGSGELTIGERKGSFPGMLKERSFEIVRISKERPRGLEFDSRPDRVVKYNGRKMTVKIG